MTEGDALRRAVLTYPDDDTPRVVYADWLEDNGDPERAEFVRVQVEVLQREAADGSPEFWDAMRRKHAGCKGCSPWCRLRRQDQMLFTKHGIDWFLTPKLTAVRTEAGSSLGHTRPHGREAAVAVVRRGFVEEVACSWADWWKHHESLFWHPDQRREFVPTAHPLRVVHLTTMPGIHLQIDDPGGRAAVGIYPAARGDNGRLFFFPVAVPLAADWPARVLQAFCRPRWPGVEFRPPVARTDLGEWREGEERREPEVPTNST